MVTIRRKSEQGQRVHSSRSTDETRNQRLRGLATCIGGQRVQGFCACAALHPWALRTCMLAGWGPLDFGGSNYFTSPPSGASQQSAPLGALSAIRHVSRSGRSLQIFLFFYTCFRLFKRFFLGFFLCFGFPPVFLSFSTKKIFRKKVFLSEKTCFFSFAKSHGFSSARGTVVL